MDETPPAPATEPPPAMETEDNGSASSAQESAPGSVLQTLLFCFFQELCLSIYYT